MSTGVTITLIICGTAIAFCLIDLVSQSIKLKQLETTAKCLANLSDLNDKLINEKEEEKA